MIVKVYTGAVNNDLKVCIGAVKNVCKGLHWAGKNDLKVYIGAVKNVCKGLHWGSKE